nr:tyrosine-type recombinase/integrase [Streptomyces sp. ADI96-02]
MHLRRHDLRHTGLTWFADAGVQVHVLRRIAGHGSLTTTQRYLHPDVPKITAAWSPTGPQKRSRAGFGLLRNRP